MSSADSLQPLAERLAQQLLTARLRLVTAESCTGGWLAKVLTDIPGSSQWFECGYVTYSNAAKARDLGVSAATLGAQGAVSEATVREMAAGALRVSGADLALAISGIAGPDGGTPDKPVGTVWFAAACRAVTQKSAARGASQTPSGSEPAVELFAHCQYFTGNRDAVRYQAVRYALQMLIQYV